MEGVVRKGSEREGNGEGEGERDREREEGDVSVVGREDLLPHWKILVWII